MYTDRSEYFRLQGKQVRQVERAGRAGGRYDKADRSLHCDSFVRLGVCTPGSTVCVAIAITLVELSPPPSTLMPRARRASSFWPLMADSIGDVVLLWPLVLALRCIQWTLVQRVTSRWVVSSTGAKWVPLLTSKWRSLRISSRL
jgi:hypothetical protein